MPHSHQKNGANRSALHNNNNNNNNSSNNTVQPLIPPMIRNPVPEHIEIRAHLRASLYFQQPLQRPPLNYHNTLQIMTQNIQNQYSQPSHSHVDYGRRQTHLAEYGLPPPNITPPITLTPVITELTVTPSASGYKQQQEQQTPPDLWSIHVPAPSLSQPSPDLRAIHLAAPSLTQSAPRQRSVNDLAQVAERMAFNINPATGLNEYGMLSGYMPATVVDMIPGAWDPSGKTLWLPRAMREEEREKGKGVTG
jgi:hypothetical protein